MVSLSNFQGLFYTSYAVQSTNTPPPPHTHTHHTHTHPHTHTLRGHIPKMHIRGTHSQPSYKQSGSHKNIHTYTHTTPAPLSLTQRHARTKTHAHLRTHTEAQMYTHTNDGTVDIIHKLLSRKLSIVLSG